MNPLIDQNIECKHLNVSGDWISILSFLKKKKEKKKNYFSCSMFSKYWKIAI